MAKIVLRRLACLLLAPVVNVSAQQAATEPTGQPFAPRVDVVLLALCLALVQAQAGVTLALLPHFMSSEGWSLEAVSLLPAAAVLTSALSGLFAGPVSDVVGRRQIILIALLCLSLSLLLHARIDGLGVFLALRALTGFGAGLLRGRASNYVADVLHPDAQSRAQRLLLSGHIFGQILGVPLGLWMVSWVPYGWVYAGCGALLLVLLVLAARHLEGPVGAAYFTRAQRQGFQILVLWETTSASTRTLMLVSALATAASTLALSGVVLFAQGTLNWSTTTVAQVLFWGGCLQLAGIWWGALGGERRRWKERLVLVFALLALASLSGLLPNSGALWALLILLLSLGGGGVRLAPLQHWMNHWGSEEHRGTRSSLVHFGNDVSRLLVALALPYVAPEQSAMTLAVVLALLYASSALVIQRYCPST